MKFDNTNSVERRFHWNSNQTRILYFVGFGTYKFDEWTYRFSLHVYVQLFITLWHCYLRQKLALQPGEGIF